ncbi:MAG: hypothetical protein E7123_07595 [Bacteroidales bacterium]|nr:hypothetical protein [Bacteroidales bacterium]
MKRLFCILNIVVLFSSCTTDQELGGKDIPLPAPELICEGNNVNWTFVDNARSYEMDIDGRLISIRSDVLSYNVASNGYGEYAVKIRAVGTPGYSDSPFSNTVSVSVTQYAPQPEMPLSIGDSLRAHPRLLFPKGLEGKIRQMIWTPEGKFLNVIHKEIENYADQLLNKEPFLRETLTGVSIARENLGRIFYLSYMYRMTESEKYAARAERELLAIAAQYDKWRPDHFLTTSEMTLAFAIGYDWLHDFLSEESKKIIVETMIAKGLDESATASYRHSVGNWNSVCNACMIASALAVYEHQPEKSAAMITEAIENNRKAVETFGPHGGYPEGYSYWHYGTVYQTMLFEVLKTAIGYESNLPDNATGFDSTGAYAMMMTTPTGRCYSYADVAIGANVSPASFWLARHFNHPEWLYVDRQMLMADNFEQEDKLWRFNPCILLYSVGLDISKVVKPEQNWWYSDGNQPLYVWRSGFDSVNDTYLGIKGGYPKQGHSHMDSGAFYYERDGVIWSGDPGSDSYNLPGYDNYGQNAGRWDIFRPGLAAHSTISFDDAEHVVTGKTPITEYFTEEAPGATVDLTPACSNKVSKAVRTIRLEDDILNVVDNVIPSADMQVRWNMITKAQPQADGDKKVILSSGSRQMHLEVVSPDNALIYILPAEGGEGEALNPDYMRVGFTAQLEKGKEYELRVTLTPIQ